MHTVLWDVTPYCNLRCSHCYNADLYFNGVQVEQLPKAKALEVVDRLVAGGCQKLHLLGGEPLACAYLDEIIERGSAGGVRVSFNTNGTLLTRSRAERLVDAGIDDIAISLDGITAEVNDAVRGDGSFDLATTGARNLAEAIRQSCGNSTAGLAFVAMNHNLHQIPDLLPFVDDLGLTALNVIIPYFNGNARDIGSTMDVDMVQLAQAYERLVDKHSNEYPGIMMQLDGRSAVPAYINLRYPNAKVVVNPMTRHCAAGSGTSLIRADGSFLPCGMIDHADYGLPNLARGEYDFQPVGVDEWTDLRQVVKSRGFASFRQFKARRKEHDLPETCEGCIFVDECSPCPLIFGQTSNMKECRWAFEQMALYFDEIADNRFRWIEAGAFQQSPDGNGILWDREAGSYRRISGIATEICDRIEKGWTFDEICTDLFDIYGPDGVPELRIRFDVAAFISDVSFAANVATLNGREEDTRAVLQSR